MKLHVLYLPLFLFITISNSQVNRYSKPVQPARFSPMSFDELSMAALTLQKRYEANQNYLYALKNWILELKPQINEQKFINRLDGEYSILESMEGDDLARATTLLKKRENSIRKIISEYNSWLNTQGTTESENYNYNTSNGGSNMDNLALGIEFYQKGDYVKAIRNFSTHLETDVNNTDVLFYRALSKSNIGDNYGAIDDYDKIISQESRYPLRVAKLATVYNNKSYSLVKLEKNNEALPLVQKALELDKSEWFIWDTRGEIYYNLGKYDLSISDFTRAIKIQGHEHSYYLRGLAYLKLNKREMGCRDLSKSNQMGNELAYEALAEYCIKN